MWERGYGFPQFKKQMRSFLYPQPSTCPVKDGMVDLPKIGRVKMWMSRPIPDGFEVKQIQVVRKASDYYVNLILQSDAVEDLREVGRC